MSYGAHFTSLTATVVMMLVIMQSTKQLLHSAYKLQQGCRQKSHGLCLKSLRACKLLTCMTLSKIPCHQDCGSCRRLVPHKHASFSCDMIRKGPLLVYMHHTFKSFIHWHSDKFSMMAKVPQVGHLVSTPRQ